MHIKVLSLCMHSISGDMEREKRTKNLKLNDNKAYQTKVSFFLPNLSALCLFVPI